MLGIYVNNLSFQELEDCALSGGFKTCVEAAFEYVSKGYDMC